MKKLILTALFLLQFSSYGIEAFVKSTASSVHDGQAITSAVYSGGDLSLRIDHEDPATGHGCTFVGEKRKDGIYRDTEISSCSIEVISNGNSINIRERSGSNCRSVCGVSAELNIDGLIYQNRE